MATVDKTYVLDAVDGIGEGHGSLPKGSKVVVVEVVGPLTAGVGESGEDTVIFEHEYLHANGPIIRRSSLPASDFDRCFKIVKG